jgi:putative ABC transport system substrate-binding protein
MPSCGEQAAKGGDRNHLPLDINTMHTVLKSLLPRLAATLLGLFTMAGFAEEPQKIWEIAVFRTAAPFAVEIEQGLKDGLAKLGYVDGRNITYLPTVIVKSRIEDFAETAVLVKQKLTDEQPDLFATISTQSSIPAWKILEPTDIPMVFSGVTFPVDGGLIAAYGQPTGKNITGIGYSVSPKQRLELIRQLFPDAQRFGKIAFAYSGQVLQDATYVKYLRAAGDVADWKILYIDYFDYAQNNASLRLLIDKLQKSNSDLVFGWYDLDMLGNDSRAFTELLDKLRKPLIAVTRKGVDEGAIGGVLTDHQQLGEQQAQMIDRVMKGEKPGDIPPVEPTTYLIELNLKKAQELGIQFDQKMINAARRVVQ